MTLEVTTDMDQPTPSLRDSGNVCSPKNMANEENLTSSETIIVFQLELTKVNVNYPERKRLGRRLGRC